MYSVLRMTQYRSVHWKCCCTGTVAVTTVLRYSEKFHQNRNVAAFAPVRFCKGVRKDGSSNGKWQVVLPYAEQYMVSYQSQLVVHGPSTVSVVVGLSRNYCNLKFKRKIRWSFVLYTEQGMKNEYAKITCVSDFFSWRAIQYQYRTVVLVTGTISGTRYSCRCWSVATCNLAQLLPTVR